MTSWIIGNWKLNPCTIQQATTLSKHVAKEAQTLTNCQLMVAPSSVHLSAVQQAIHPLIATDATLLDAQTDQQNVLALVAQDVCAHTVDTGAYTGDNSASQLQDVGVQWVIIGHSERRQYYQEDNELLLNKVANTLAGGLGVIFCIGESEAHYIEGKTQTVLSEQLGVISGLFAKDEALTAHLADRLIIAYEPVWAIGTGKVPSVDEVTRVHQDIRANLKNISANLGDVPIIYGGSVKPDNASEFASSPLINGVLVGGASLVADSFIGIARAFDNKAV